MDTKKAPFYTKCRKVGKREINLFPNGLMVRTSDDPTRPPKVLKDLIFPRFRIFVDEIIYVTTEGVRSNWVKIICTTGVGYLKTSLKVFLEYIAPVCVRISGHLGINPDYIIGSTNSLSLLYIGDLEPVMEFMVTDRFRINLNPFVQFPEIHSIIR